MEKDRMSVTTISVWVRKIYCWVISPFKKQTSTKEGAKVSLPVVIQYFSSLVMLWSNVKETRPWKLSNHEKQGGVCGGDRRESTGWACMQDNAKGHPKRFLQGIQPQACFLISRSDNSFLNWQVSEPSVTDQEGPHSGPGQRQQCKYGRETV